MGLFYQGHTWTAGGEAWKWQICLPPAGLQAQRTFGQEMQNLLLSYMKPSYLPCHFLKALMILDSHIELVSVQVLLSESLFFDDTGKQIIHLGGSKWDTQTKCLKFELQTLCVICLDNTHHKGKFALYLSPLKLKLVFRLGMCQWQWYQSSLFSPRGTSCFACQISCYWFFLSFFRPWQTQWGCNHPWTLNPKN